VHYLQEVMSVMSVTEKKTAGRLIMTATHQQHKKYITVGTVIM